MTGLRCLAVCVAIASFVSASLSAPAGFSASSQQGIATGVSALAYGPDGTLYLSSGGPITVISPGGQRSQLAVSGATLESIGGMAFANGQLYVTDNKGWGDGAGNLYAVNPTTGVAQSLISGIDAIEDVAIASDGRIYITDAAGLDPVSGQQIGKVWEASYDPVVGGYSGHVIADGLCYTAGIGVDHSGNVIFQQVNSSFAGEVYRLSVSREGGNVSYGSPVLLAGGLSAGFDMTMDGQDNVFVSGNGGVFKLDRNQAGDFTGSATAFDGSGFTTEVTFLAGSAPFDAFAGIDGGKLSYIPSYMDPSVVTVTAVPEPMSLLLVGSNLSGLLLRRR